MPFAGILEIHKQFLRGASEHPKEALFQNGLSIFNMGMSYVNISLVHLADGCCGASRRAVVSSSCRPLTALPSRRLIAQAGCCVASRCPTVSSSRRATLLSSRCSLTAPPSCCLIAQAGCCLTSCHATVSSSHHAALSSSCRPLTAHLTAPSGCCLTSCHAVVSSSCRPLPTAPPSRHLAPAGCCVASRCAALSSSPRASE